MTWSGRRTALAVLVVAAAAAAATTLAAVNGGAVPVPAASATPAPPPAATATPPPATPSPPPATSVLRVYSNNIENLVEHRSDGRCRAVSAAEHLASMLVDEAGEPGTAEVAAPDLLLLQQLAGAGQAQEYADALSAEFGYPAGTYRALVAWSAPEPWGESHECAQAALAAAKARQTNGIVYNTRTLTLTGDPVRWSAGWLKPGTRYAAGEGCTAYQPPGADADPLRLDKWKRTSALAARFTVPGSATSVFAATLHLPQQNRDHPCAGDADPGIAGTGIRLAPAAERLLERAQVRVLGVDANRTGIAADALARYGVTGHGDGPTVGTRTRIDYLFVRGAVRPSGIGHTVAGTRSTHRALYGFIDL